MNTRIRFLSRKELVRREIQKEIENHIKHREIILITGVRRGGKSSLRKLIGDDINRVKSFRINGSTSSP